MPSVTNGSIQLIDPIDSVSKLPKDLNGTPEYEKMFIFVELSASRRGRSVIVNSEGKGNRVEKDGFGDLNVNLMGANVDGDPASFTTKWTDNASDSERILEGFGISQVDIKITSSFIPEVTVEFVDIRGMAFFNKGKGSPYSILFDFPPALYTLTVKGYYGKALTYELHLVNHTTRFESSTGNYYTTANFIARTFAPLTDIPFKMVEILPLVDQNTKDGDDVNAQAQLGNNVEVNSEQENVDARVAPRNTHEMITKLKALYDYINEIKDNSEESDAITESQKQLKLGGDLAITLNNFKSQLPQSLQNSAIKIIQDINVDIGNDKENGRIVNSIGQYNDNIVGIAMEGISNNNEEMLTSRLYLGVQLLPNKKNDIQLSEDEQIKRKTLIIETLESLKTTILDNAKKFLSVTNADVGDPNDNIKLYDIENNENNTNEFTEYVCLDISLLYVKLYKYVNVKTQKLKDNNDTLTTKISETAKSKLGMELTPYQVFKIICDDIDKFFNKIRKTNVDAENHHNDFFDQINGNDNVIDGKKKKLTKLYSFPLYVRENVTCGVKRQARAYPNDLSESLDRPFPEVELVENFVNAFINLKKEKAVEDLKTQEDGAGNNKWIPVTPLDSELSGIPDYSSPFANIELRGVEDEITSSILNVVLNRFYIASQFTYGTSFYSTDGKYLFGFGPKELKKSELIKFVAGAEAINLTNSLVNNDTISFFERKASQFKNSSDDFYSELNTLKVGNYSTISSNTELSLNLDQDTKLVYKNRTNPNYEGVLLLPNSQLPSAREIDDSDSSKNPVDIYIRENDGFWKSLINSVLSDDEAKISRFTEENIPFINDLDYDFTSFKSRYAQYLLPSDSSSNTGGGSSITNSLIKIWGSLLSRADAGILAILNDGAISDATKAFWLVSNYGYSRSYFNEKVNGLFKNPAVVEVSKFSTHYIGALLYYNNNTDNVKTQIDEIYSTGIGKGFPFSKSNITADALSVEKLSAKDKDIFLNDFFNFIDNSDDDGYRTILNQITNMINDVQLLMLTNNVDKKNEYESLLKSDNINIMKGLCKRVGVLNFSEFTFSNETETETTFVPLSITNQDLTQSGKKEANDIYFKEFFRVLGANLPDKRQEVLEQDAEFTKNLSDDDIKTQLYYTFKSISDKWISGLGSVDKGFPLNRGAGDPLINKFVFVDRAMNPIGDQVILNVQSLIDLAQDYDVNIFTVFSRLLSENGFELFPLQNFMVHSEGSWSDLFKIYETVNQPSTPMFVCMYIGGTSSTLNSVSSDYEDDGILDLGSEELPDFKQKDCDDQEVEDKETAKVPNGSERFKYSQVKAFRVRYGEQNQSFFTDIQLDSKEFPETAESLAILSNIAGDESNASPVPKGQNLFNLYENRAYSTTVSMLGNVMIQPTQYFQLENIPMYSGAYVILDVNHRITPNHMITNFHGTRILKYPNPFVTDFATSVGSNGSTADRDKLNSNEITSKRSGSVGTVTNSKGDVLIAQLQHNSMYDLKIS